MVDDVYTDKEDIAVNEAIEFNNCDNKNDDDADGNNDDATVNVATRDDNNVYVNYSKDVTKKKKKKGKSPKQTTSEKPTTKCSKRRWHINKPQSTMVRVTWMLRETPTARILTAILYFLGTKIQKNNSNQLDNARW